METPENRDDAQPSTESTSVESLFNLDKYFPSWFDTLDCFVLLLAYETVLVIGEFSAILAYFLFTIFVFAASVYKPTTSEEEPTAGSEREAKSYSLGKFRDKEFFVFISLYWWWTPLVRIGIFLYCSRRGFAEVIRNLGAIRMAWPDLLIVAGVELDFKLDAPEPVLISFFNEKIERLWPYAIPSFEEFLKTRFQPSLKSRLQLRSTNILRRPEGKETFQVLSAKVVDRSLKKIVIDIGFIYCGDYCGFALWPSGEKLYFRSFQANAKLRLDLRYGNWTRPEEMALMGHNVDTLHRVIISLKKINKLYTWSDEITQEVSSPLQKRFLTGVEDVIHTCFPLDLTLVTSTTGRAQQTRPTLPIRRPESQAIPDIIQNIPTTSSTRLPERRLPGGYLEDVTASSQRLEAQEILHHTSIHRASSSAPQLQRTCENASAEARDTHGQENHDKRASAQLTNEATSVLPSINSEPVLAVDPELRESMTKDLIAGTQVATANAAYGTIELTTKFQSPRSLLVSIHKIRNLPKRKGRTPQPYVKLVLHSQDESDFKESTEVLDKTTDPVFEKSFRFQLSKPLSQYTLKVTVKTKHKLSHALAQVLLFFTPTSSNTAEERKWYELNSPKTEQIPHEVFYKE
ncbi:uncharacterized protein LOC135195562 isoform X1 [Macrobrachium nipponense]|uniref:uncharacterized protein LOC135195562 isoform X1 n=1 Tax=Macrobrachium nipponense TaxID=159736 RepID=UPI0030C833F8